MEKHDQEYMVRAIQLAHHGIYSAAPNPCVGCVIVKAGQIIGEGGHQYTGGPHAEVIALQQAGTNARAATAYVTLEPCSHHGRTGPCADALIAAGIQRVVVAMEDPNPRVSGQGIERLRDAGVAVVVGVGQAMAEQLNLGFISRMRRGRPYVRCKLAMSVDGRTAMASGESQWITSAAARQDVQRLRARSSAIMTGIGTVLADDPALTVRPGEMGDDGALLTAAPLRQPLRIILDSAARITPATRLLQSAGQKLLVTGTKGIAAANLLASQVEGLLVATLSDADNTASAGVTNAVVNGLDLTGLFDLLAPYELNDLLIEAGATLSGAMLSAGYIDELIIYMAPKLMGNRARGLFDLPWLESMAQCVDIDIRDIRAVGTDWRISARINQPDNLKI